MPVINRIADYFEEMKSWRHHLHAHPELDFDCHETAQYVSERLSEFGVDEIHRNIGRTGLVGIINGQGQGQTIGLRSDMDALPIQEILDHPYKSKFDGKMHACGHDGHMTMLLGAAKYLAETRNFSGRVALIFQPAEEGGGGGREMCEEGMMDRFDISQVYGIHNWPTLKEGKIGVRPGPIMAAADHFTITIKGEGGHAAIPHNNLDPLPVAAQIILALQTIVSRRIDPLESAVISTSMVQGGDAFNIIPSEVVLTGTVRTFSASIQEFVIQRMSEIATHTAKAQGLEAKLHYEKGYPATINDAKSATFAADVAEELFGAKNAERDVAPSMASEDFSYMLEERPGAYVHLGQGDTPALHHEEYDFNDDIAPIGASFFARLVETAQPLDRKTS